MATSNTTGRDLEAPAATRPLPWRALVLLAAAGTLLGVGLTLVDLSQTRERNGGLAHTGPRGPAAELMARDFPDEPQFKRGQHDGPMFYAIARSPWDFDQAAASLDRPQYRLQHPLFSWIAWTVHPVGGGDALLWSMFGVGVASMALAGIAAGALSHTLRGPVWLAAVVPLLPGATMSLRITVGDALAVGLVVAALAASLRGRTLVAVLFGVAAVLTKEPTILALVGLALWRRDRDGLWLVGVPCAVAGTWAVFLHFAVENSGAEVIEFAPPPSGLLGAIDIWRLGGDRYALVAVVGALVAAVAALVLRRPLAHPLWFPVALNLAFVLMLNDTVLGLERNGTRMTMLLLVLSLVALVTPAPTAPDRPPPPPPNLSSNPTSSGAR